MTRKKRAERPSASALPKVGLGRFGGTAAAKLWQSFPEFSEFSELDTLISTASAMVGFGIGDCNLSRGIIGAAESGYVAIYNRRVENSDLQYGQDCCVSDRGLGG